VAATVERLGLQSHVMTLPPLRHDELPLLFSAATALVYPSLFEGGGLPVLEAMACGCPVAAARIPSLEEYAGDAAEYFDATELSAIEAAMAGVQSSVDGRERMRALGLARVEKFRAPYIVPRLLQAYRMAAGLNSRVAT
jgi:glycosyltransferase involved in cell wall biosynthesis